MRILIAGQAFYRPDNGQAVFTIRLAEGLAQAGHDVVVLAPSEQKRPFRQQINNLTLQTVPTLPLAYNTNITGFSHSMVKQLLSQFQPEIIHIQDHYFLCRTLVKLAQKQNIPVVGTNHFLPDNLTDNFRLSGSIKRRLNQRLWHNMLGLYNQLAAVTTPTKTAVAILRQQNIIPPAQAISCGVDQETFHPQPHINQAHMRQKYGLSSDKTLFLYVGRVDREKGLDTIVKAIAQLQRDDIQFGIVGKGSYRPGLEALAKELNVADKVIFTGYVPSDDLPHLLNSADVFTMPSHAELQSIATLEAMSCGLPILAANARALPELVEHGVNGYLFNVDNISDAAQGMLTLTQQRAQWPDMQTVSLQKAQPHALYNTIRRYTNWYRQVLATPQHTPQVIPLP